MANQLLKLIVHIVHADTGQPLTGPTFRVRFYDLDLFGSDRLGESGLSSKGVAEILCSEASFQTGLLGRLFERLREKAPDVYIEVAGASGVPLYRSRVEWNVDAAKLSAVTGMTDRTVDLGTYRFRKGEGVIDPMFDRPTGRGPMM